METYGWTEAAAASLSNAIAPRLVIAEQGESLRGVAQLGVVRGSLSGRLEMIGISQLNEPEDFVYVDRAALEAVARRVVAVRRPVFLGRLRAQSPTISALRVAAKGRGVVVVRPQASCPYIALDESWQDPESHLSSRRRSDIRRARRRAEQQGEVRAEIVNPSVAELGPLLAIALAVEARSWKGAAGTALVNDPIRGRQLRQFAAWASRNGILRIGLLKIGDIYAAMQIAAEHNGAYWLLKIGFDSALANCSPGNLLLAESLRYSADKGLTSLEFLGTVEPWTRVWTESERKCVSLRYYPFNPRGAAALVADGAGKLLRRFRASHAESDAKAAAEAEE